MSGTGIMLGMVWAAIVGAAIGLVAGVLAGWLLRALAVEGRTVGRARAGTRAVAHHSHVTTDGWRAWRR